MRLSPDADFVRDLELLGGTVYLASPISTFGTQLATAMVARAKNLFPLAEVLVAEGLYLNTQDWLDSWPEVLATIDAYVFYADSDRTIGMGVAKEMSDAKRVGLPVYFLDEHGDVWPHEAITLKRCESGSRSSFAHVSAQRA